MRQITVIILISLLILDACSPVRTKRSGQNISRSSEKVTTRKATSSNSVSENKNETKTYNSRFSDTTTIVINPSTGSGSTVYSVNDQFAAAIQEFDDEQYESACNKAAYFAETFAYGDSLYYESLFLLSECSIINEAFDDAEKTLKNLLHEKQLPSSVHEKVLVRLGQLYCVKNKPKKAEKYFRELKRKYPRSIYLPLANCNSVRVDE